MKRLPYGGFQWVPDPELINSDHNDDQNRLGLILEVDPECPKTKEHHDDFKDLTLSPEYASPLKSKQKRLMLQLTEKTIYVIHHKALKQALNNGIKLNKIHKALCFQQSRWLKSSVEYNIEMRTTATNEFEVNFFQLIVLLHSTL